MLKRGRKERKNTAVVNTRACLNLKTVWSDWFEEHGLAYREA
jgi:hypothetical protein